MLYKIWATIRCINIRQAHNKCYAQNYNPFAPQTSKHRS